VAGSWNPNCQGSAASLNANVVEKIKKVPIKIFFFNECYHK
jgi:hypothetical protein